MGYKAWKAFVIILLFVAALAFPDELADITAWNNVRDEMHRLAKELTQYQNEHPDIEFIARVSLKVGIEFSLTYDNERQCSVIMAMLNSDKTTITEARKASIKNGARVSLTSLYGKCERLEPDDQVIERWECSTWFKLASLYIWPKYGFDTILLRFWPEDL
jgi:hypothetical protein